MSDKWQKDWPAEWDDGWPYHGVVGFFQWWWERERVSMVLTLAAGLLPVALLLWMVVR